MIGPLKRVAAASGLLAMIVSCHDGARPPLSEALRSSVTATSIEHQTLNDDCSGPVDSDSSVAEVEKAVYLLSFNGASGQAWSNIKTGCGDLVTSLSAVVSLDDNTVVAFDSRRSVLEGNRISYTLVDPNGGGAMTRGTSDGATWTLALVGGGDPDQGDPGETLLATGTGTVPGDPSLLGFPATEILSELDNGIAPIVSGE
jgi:hypothetical protein